MSDLEPDRPRDSENGDLDLRSKIVSLQAENVKRLKAIHIEPDGSPVVIVAGRNAQGKSSVLDAITIALKGKAAKCKKPVRDGERSAIIVCDLGDLTITRTISADDKWKLTVRSKDGARYDSPQKILDNLVGQLTFDPLEFSRMEPVKQLVTLKNLAGLNFGTMDERRAGLYDKRTEANREVKRIEAQMEKMGDLSDAPDEPVDIDELATELEKTNERNRQLEQEEQDHSNARKRVETLTKELKIAKLNLEELSRCHSGSQKTDPAPIVQQMKDAQDINQRVRLKKEQGEQQKKLMASRVVASELTEDIKAIDQKKTDLLEQAQFPVEGLGLDDAGIIYQGIPFEQASAAERLRVSIAMGLAMNPELRVLLIRNGNDLDADNLALVQKMAADADAQVWLERIDASGEVAVVIEDGEIAK